MNLGNYLVFLGLILLDGSSWLCFSSTLQELNLVVQINSLNSLNYLGRPTTQEVDGSYFGPKHLK